MVTVAVRRVNISDRSRESLLDYIDTDRIFILPNTAGCYTADEAIRTARLGREAGLVELGEARGDRRRADALPRQRGADRGHAHPGEGGLRRAALHQRRSRSPAASWKRPAPSAVMPLGAPIGSGLGHPERQQHPHHPRVREGAGDRRRRRRHGVRRGAGHGARRRRRADEHRHRRRRSTRCRWPRPCSHAVIAGRLAFLAGRIPRKMYATASSPVEGMVGR